MTFRNERKRIRSVIQSHFLDNNNKEMKPKSNVMETKSFSCPSRAHQPNISPRVNSHVKHHCHDTDSQQPNTFAQLCDDTVTSLHVQLEPVDNGAMA